MTEITTDERGQIVHALDREAARLDALVRDYKTHRGNTRNPAVRAMADEGAANMEERVKELRSLAAKLRGEPPATDGKPR